MKSTASKPLEAVCFATSVFDMATSAWSPSARDEYCMDYNNAANTSISFNSAIPYDLYTIQVLLIAFFSTIANVGVLYVHWTIPPHPKFLLLLDRKISIRMHVLSGTIEIIIFVVGWFVPLVEDSHRALVYINAAASAVHCLTALYQTPIVFGTQAVMLPAYVGCVALKIACVVDVFLHPNCALKFIRLYNIHSVYTWCRVFIFLFTKLQIMNENMYTVSIMFAGFCCAPAYGPGINVIFALMVLVYGFCLTRFASPETVARQLTENSRDMFDNPSFQSTLSALGGSGSGSTSSCPFGQVGKASREGMLKSLFNSMDTSQDGRVSLEEIRAFAGSHKSEVWTNLIAAYLSRHPEEQGRGMDYETFKQVMSSKGLMDLGIDKEGGKSKMEHIVSKQASYDEKARFLFDAINQKKDAYISLDELTYLLIQYSLPISDVERIVRKFDSQGNDGRLSFDEFKAGFRPLILFQIKELKGRMREIATHQQRTQILKSFTSTRVMPNRPAQSDESVKVVGQP